MFQGLGPKRPESCDGNWVKGTVSSVAATRQRRAEPKQLFTITITITVTITITIFHGSAPRKGLLQRGNEGGSQARGFEHRST